MNFRFLVQDGSRFFACVSLFLVTVYFGAETNRKIVNGFKVDDHFRFQLWLFNADAAVVTNMETRDVQSLSESNKNELYYIKSRGIIQSFVFRFVFFYRLNLLRTECLNDLFVYEVKFNIQVAVVQ